MSREQHRNQEAWLAARRDGIGASEAAAVLGVDPYCSPLLLYARKLGLADSAGETIRMRRGRLLEPLVAALYAEETARPVEALPPWTLTRREDLPWMVATLDRELPPHDGRARAPLELKTSMRGDLWQDEPPLHVLVQLQHQIAVTRSGWGSLGALLYEDRFVWADVERNDRFIALMVEREQEFMERLRRLDPPPAAATSLVALARMYAHPEEREVELPPEALEWDDQRQRACAEVERWQAAKDDASARLMQAIGDASYGRRGDLCYSWKRVRQELRPQEARVREFRILKRLKSRGAGP